MNVFDGYRITSPYGPRKDPFNGSTTFHTGIDLVKSQYAPIPAFISGEVTHAKEGVIGSGFGNFGIVVSIKDKHGALHCYAHLDSVRVTVGQMVEAGQIVGFQGNTGRSTGSHLHYEIRLNSSPSYGFGTHTDPGEYLESYHVKEVKPNVQEVTEEEEEEKLKLTKYQQNTLVETLQKLIDKNVINDKSWVTKAKDGTLTLSELTWLNTILIANK